MAIRIEPSDATLGARVMGVQLAALDPADWRAIEEAFHRHAVLIFPGQQLHGGEQVAFAQRFGEIEHIVPGVDTVPISNRKRDGSLYADDEGPMQILRGNEGWHTDSSYMPLAAKASVLSAEVVPSRGGETEWADMRAAYESLDAELRERIAGLSAYHSLKYSQARIGHAGGSGFGYGFSVDAPPLRPLVKVHPVTGRPSLFIGRHAYGIPGLEPAESERLLDRLVDEACRPPRVLRHAWQPGDVVIWDNRCVLHRARPWNHGEARVMHHTRIAGDPATESALPNSS
jgi:alpha-ketoglutarate-dependent taurine dioxygenase